jgi:ketosteroid isomerase-like protein
MKRRAVLSAAALAAPAMTSAQPAPDIEALQREVWDTEVAFARTMAQRDLAAFERFLSPHTVWWSGPQGSALRGKAAVVDAWKRFYEGPQAPFSWAPDEVVVIGDGTLATSTGPVRAPDGKVVARFRSVWRREPDGRWLIVLDRGEAIAPPAKPASSP